MQNNLQPLHKLKQLCSNNLRPPGCRTHFGSTSLFLSPAFPSFCRALSPKTQHGWSLKRSPTEFLLVTGLLLLRRNMGFTQPHVHLEGFLWRSWGGGLKGFTRERPALSRVLFSPRQWELLGRKSLPPQLCWAQGNGRSLGRSPSCCCTVTPGFYLRSS